MEPFVYHDIFDTKGIEYIVVIFFLLLLIPAWVFLNRPLKRKESPVHATGILTAGILRVPQGLFFNRNHLWTSLEPSGMARIGADDLLLHLTGGVQLDFLQNPGSRVKKGDPLVKISRNGKELSLASPVTGTLEQLNMPLTGEPAQLLDDPYGAWLCRIRPEDWQRETSTCYLGKRASGWMKDELIRFKDFLSTALGGESFHVPYVVMQEGGELTDFPLAGLDKEVWAKFQEKFLSDHG